jgi:hypothetical protein
LFIAFFPTAAAAEDYVTSNDFKGFKMEVPAGLTRRTDYDNPAMRDSNGQPSQIHCQYTDVAGEARIVGSCACHPPGSIVVAITSAGQPFAPGTQIDDFKKIVLNLDGVAASNLVDFLEFLASTK